MDHGDYLAALQADAALLREAARQGRDILAPSCPGWTAGHLLVHVGRAYNWVAEIVGAHAQGPVPIRPDDHAFDRADPGVFAWFDQSLDRARATLAAAAPDAPVWSWSADRRVGFWLRLLAHETALHRWDAQLAHGAPAPLAGEQARDYIDFTLDHWLPACRAGSHLPSRGESYHLHRTDGAGEWTLRFGHNALAVAREHARGDVALRGPAADLYLFLWHRLPAERLEVLGDRAVLDRFFELVPPR
jgi:uncharacterized protein (TIGR03083 family)